MSSKIRAMELELRIKKMDANADEMRLNKLKLLEKADNIDREVSLVEEQIAKLQKELDQIKGE
jgi:hypothetical protein